MVGTRIESEGTVTVKVDPIRKITLANILRVGSYDLSTEGKFVIHRIEFIHGGNAMIGYSKTGKLMRFEPNSSTNSVDGNHIILDEVD